jgi:hypothetical protein
MDILTSHHILLLIFPASSLADHFQMCILGHMFGGCIGSVAVNELVLASYQNGISSSQHDRYAEDESYGVRLPVARVSH